MNKFCVINGNNSVLLKAALLERGVWKESEEEDLEIALKEAAFLWKPINLPIKLFLFWDKLLQNPQQSQPIFNHFENNRVICTKTGLIRSLKSYYKSKEKSTKFNYSIFQSTPTSFLISPNIENEEYHVFLEHFHALKIGNFAHEKVPAKHCLENYWILKPANQNQGKGIELFHKLKDIQNFLNQKPLNSIWIAQKYIEKPLLYNGRKFDIRVWALFTSEKAFFYRKGYIRTSSDNYSLENLNNYIHLTNNCLQKYGENYGKHEIGNTITFLEFSRFLEEKFEKKIDFDKDVISRIKDLIIDVFESSKDTINPNKRKKCFELLGFDFLIDEDFRTWLLEVNTNPYLGVPNEEMKELLEKMIDDLLEITIDGDYMPKESFLEKKKDQENDFLMIFNETENLNLRRNFNVSCYPIEELNPQGTILLKKNSKENSKKQEKNWLSNEKPKPSKEILQPIKKPPFPIKKPESENPISQKQLPINPLAKNLVFEEWERKKLLQKEQEQKREIQRKMSIEQQELLEHELWKNRLMQKIQSQKASMRNVSKSRKKHNKKGKKRQKSMLLLIENSPFNREDAKTTIDYFPNLKQGLSKEKSLDENEFINLLVEKYNNL